MPKRLRLLVAGLYAFASLTTVTQVAWAEEEDKEKEDPWVVKWSNGFRVEKGDEFKLKFGGRIQADFTFAEPDASIEAAFGRDEFQNGFEFRRARLFFEGTLYSRVKFKAQYDFAGGTSVKDLWIGFDHDFGEVRVGHYKEYFSLEELTSSKYVAFLEPSLPVEAFAPSRNSGVGVHGKSGDLLNWGVGAFYDADEFGVSTSEKDLNITGRIGFRPIYQDKGTRFLHLGLAANNRERESGIRFRSRPEAHFTTRLLDTGTFAADSALILGAEIAGVLDRFWFAGEYIRADVDTPFGPDPTFDGAYIQAGYFLTDDYRRFKTGDGAFDRQKPNRPWGKGGGKGAWEAVIRFSTLDLTDAGIAGGEQDDVTLGLNWYPNPATRLMLNFVAADVDGVGDANFVLMRWQVDF